MIELLLNLGLVVLCTPLELFINHVVDIVLIVEPRQVMDLASDKKVMAKEIVQLGDYREVLRCLRENVIDEIDREGMRRKFTEQLDKRFGLISESQIGITPILRGVNVPPGRLQGMESGPARERVRPETLNCSPGRGASQG